MEWGDWTERAARVWQWLQIDTADPTLAKMLILIAVVVLLLLVLSDVYRGEIQNQDVSIDVTSHDNRFGYQDKDVVFTQQTFDIQSEKLPAHIILSHSFSIVDGAKRIDKVVRLTRRPARLRMVRTAHRVDHGQVALAPDVVLALKNRAEYLQRKALSAYTRSPWRRILQMSSTSSAEPAIDMRSYVIRIHFPLNPHFLLFTHPDKDVKATGWLTLLTSLFAVLTEFLF